MTLLVTYCTRNGATEGIAKRIASRLEKSGVKLDLRRVEDSEVLAPYDAFVFGAPVYNQAWLPEAERFVLDHLDVLTTHPLWLFSVGSFGDSKPLLGPLVRREPRHIRELCVALEPREYRVFRGVIQKNQWPLWSRAFFHLLGGRFGDHRQWTEIDAWSEGIGKALSVTDSRQN